MTTQTIPILLYHSVDTTSARGFREWVVAPDMFARQMSCLARCGYRPITVSLLASALSRGAPLPSDTVVITFDDGFRDFMTAALPVLDKHCFVATIYVVSGYVGGTSRWLTNIGEGHRRMLGWRDLRVLAEHGFEIGAHTVTHPQLDILSPATARDEISVSKGVLEDGLGAPVTSFAYPHGYANRVTRRLVSSAGFSSACRVGNVSCTLTESVFALSRFVITNDVDECKLLGLVQGEGARVAQPVDRLASLGWRLARRVRRLTEIGAGGV